MGLRVFGVGRHGSDGFGGEEVRRERFGAYFPRLFSYVRSSIGEDSMAHEIVAESFATVFAGFGDVKDEEFRIALFGVARDLCLESAKPRADDLSAREHDVVSLTFDAGLSGSETAGLLEASEESVGIDLLRALRKLRGQAGGAPLPSFLRLF